MTYDKLDVSPKNHKAAFVLQHATAEDAARAMIEGGKQKEPFYTFDMDEVYRRIMHFRKMMPRIQIFYAMKSNDSDMMLKLAISLGVSFDCASSGEIDKVLQLNCNPKSIIFALPSKTPEHLIYARESAVGHTTFDTSYELKKIKQYWPEARLLLRIRADGDCLYKLGEKFGCDFDTEAVNLLEEAAALDLRVVGIAFHVGSACSSVDSHTQGLRKARALFDHEARAGRKMHIVDIGGGFLSDKMNRIDQVSKFINMALEEYFPDPEVQVIAEPGRYICDSSTVLYCNINNVRRVKKENEIVNMLYLNDGLFGTLRYNEAWHTVEKFKMSGCKEDEKLETAILWGPSCDSTDRVMENCQVLLPRCTAFDWLVFGYQGAYTFGFASDFSCLPRPLIRSVVSEELWAKIKNCMVFSPTDFVTNPDLSTPLPSRTPRILPSNPNYGYTQTTLKL
ncbi:ornithine decarboxylase 2-like [Epargyreus clarus]|uniref:ornithine decarboxylase 2-like n=1 Tax=Epargyreus clarus TaxID=520877 RepID=UPI003C2DED4A